MLKHSVRTGTKASHGYAPVKVRSDSKNFGLQGISPADDRITIKELSKGDPPMKTRNLFTVEVKSDFGIAAEPEFTGRMLVVLDRDNLKGGIKSLTSQAGISNVAHSDDFKKSELSAESIEGADALVMDNIGIALVDAGQGVGVMGGSQVSVEGAILAIEPERICHAFSGLTEGLREYIKGYRDGINSLAEKIGLHPESEAAAGDGRNAVSDTSATWGLIATKTLESRYTGKGIRLAVLDTGFDLMHPDFAGRTIVSQSFVAGEQVQDMHGHGTHCIGTACGPAAPATLPRYGVASGAEIYVGKVLSNGGRGGDGGILAGIDWAVANKCQIVSMSLGKPTVPGERPSQIFERAARRALTAGTLIVAAAGNESQRPMRVAPVAHPANCPSIMAVAAVDHALQVARFSCAGINLGGGQIDIAGPGVNVHSSWLMPERYKTIDGTSMATPHIAGLAALWTEATGQTGAALWSLLVRNARRLNNSGVDTGSGLAQAP